MSPAPFPRYEIPLLQGVERADHEPVGLPKVVLNLRTLGGAVALQKIQNPAFRCAEVLRSRRDFRKRDEQRR